jgi:hypothetical protein
MTDSANSRTASAGTASVLNIIAGLWLIISPFVLGYTALPVALWDTLIVGIVVLVLAWARAANPERHAGLSWLNLLLGIWLIVSPFALTYSTYPRPTWNGVIVGFIVAILAIWSAAATPAVPRPVRR